MMNMDKDLKSKILDIQSKLTNASIEFEKIWLSDIFLSWRWFLSLGIAITPVIIFWKYHKKESRDRLLFVGFFVVIISSFLDFLGLQKGLWYYPVEIIPTIPSYIAYDLCFLPVYIMLLIQYKPHLSIWIKAVLFAGTSAFIGEPILVWLDLYVLVKWRYIYSFPIYILLYLAAYKLSLNKRFSPL